MQLLKIQDPRDNLAKARRKELERFAAAHGIAEIEPGMPAELMRGILRMKGLTNINIPPRPLGVIAEAAKSRPITSSNIAEINALDDLMRQYKNQPKPSEPKPDLAIVRRPSPSKSIDRMTISELRHECKMRNIKMVRTDTVATLREKLSGQDAA